MRFCMGWSELEGGRGGIGMGMGMGMGVFFHIW